MADNKSPIHPDQIESGEENSFPSILDQQVAQISLEFIIYKQKKNYFSLNFANGDSDSDQNPDGDEFYSQINPKKQNAIPTYSLFRNDVTSQSQLNAEADINLSFLNSKNENQPNFNTNSSVFSNNSNSFGSSNKSKLADIGRNKTQEHPNYQSSLFNFKEDQVILRGGGTEANINKGSEIKSGADVSSQPGLNSTQDNSFQLILNSNSKNQNQNSNEANQLPSQFRTKNSEMNQRQASLMKFKSHEADIDFKQRILDNFANKQDPQLEGQHSILEGIIQNFHKDIDQSSDDGSLIFSSHTNHNNNDQDNILAESLKFLDSNSINDRNNISSNVNQKITFDQEEKFRQKQNNDNYDEAFSMNYFQQLDTNKSHEQFSQLQKESILGMNLIKQQTFGNEDSGDFGVKSFQSKQKDLDSVFQQQQNDFINQQEQMPRQPQVINLNQLSIMNNFEQNSQQLLFSPTDFIVNKDGYDQQNNSDTYDSQKSILQSSQSLFSGLQNTQSQILQQTQTANVQSNFNIQSDKQKISENLSFNGFQNLYPSKQDLLASSNSIFGNDISQQRNDAILSPSNFLNSNHHLQSQPFIQLQSKLKASNSAGLQQQIPQQQINSNFNQNSNNQTAQNQYKINEQSIIKNTQQDVNSNSQNGYKTPVFTGLSNQFEDQQMQLLKGFEGIELNNQHQQQQKTVDNQFQQQLQSQTQFQLDQQNTNLQRQPNNNGFQNMIMTQNFGSDQQNQQVKMGTDPRQSQFMQIQTQNQADQRQNVQQSSSVQQNSMIAPPPGFEKMIPNPSRNLLPNQMNFQDVSNQQQNQQLMNPTQTTLFSAQQNIPMTSTSIISGAIPSSTQMPTQYAPQLINPFAGKQLGGPFAGQIQPHSNGNLYQIGQPGIMVPQGTHQLQQNQPVISNNVLIDQNESILVKIMCNYEESTNQQQKLNSLKGNVIKLSINQTGSKFLQRLLDNAKPQIVQFLLDEIQSHLPMVMVDNYGNFFVQELLINCSSAQRLQIFERISVDFVAICCNKKGTHTIQKIIDLVNLEAEEKFFQRVLQGHVALLASDVQGTHVIQNIIKCFDEDKRQFVFDEIFEKFVELATDYSGLSVVKIIISKTQKPENRQRLMKKLVSSAIELAQNPYGNYAIQQAFEFWEKDLCQDLIPQFFGKVYQLSLQKCSSNVIDKCILNSKPEYLNILMQELINCERLNNLITNAYGNFVVQNALKYAPAEDKVKLSEQIEKNIPNITDAKIKQKWIALLKKKSLADTKNMFKSQDSDTSETSSKGGKRHAPTSDYSGRSENTTNKSNKKSQGGGYSMINSNGGAQQQNIGQQQIMMQNSQGAMLPPQNRPPIGTLGMNYYNSNQYSQYPQMIVPQNQMQIIGGQGQGMYGQNQNQMMMPQQMQPYLNPQMQMFVPQPQQQQMMAGNMMQTQYNQQMMPNQGYMIPQQQQNLMMMGYQNNQFQGQSSMPAFMGQQIYQQQPMSQQYDPLAIPQEQSILGKRPSPAGLTQMAMTQQLLNQNSPIQFQQHYQNMLQSHSPMQQQSQQVMYQQQIQMPIQQQQNMSQMMNMQHSQQVSFNHQQMIPQQQFLGQSQGTQDQRRFGQQQQQLQQQQ